jgi:hypothetical protein
MEEFFLGLLGVIAEIIGEALTEIVFELFVALVSRAVRRFYVAFARGNQVVVVLTFAFLGLAAGLLSVYLFPHPFFHPFKMHGISLLISPVVTGLVMGQIGRIVRRRGRNAVRIESFGCGFAFALAMALVRFCLAR